MQCPYCKKEMKDNVNFCEQCGHRIVRCPTCNRVITVKSLFCPNDGTQLPVDLIEDLSDDTFSFNNVDDDTVVIRHQNRYNSNVEDTFQMDEDFLKRMEENVSFSHRFCKECGSPCALNAQLCPSCMRRNQQKKEENKRKKFKVILSLEIILAILLVICMGFIVFFFKNNDKMNQDISGIMEVKSDHSIQGDGITPIISEKEDHKETGEETKQEDKHISGLDAVSSELTLQLSDTISGGTWDTTTKIQGVEWNTDTMETLYFSYADYVISTSKEGKNLQNIYTEGRFGSLEYYNSKVFVPWTADDSSDFRLYIFDATDLNKNNYITLPDIFEQMDRDIKQYGPEAIAVRIDAVTIAPEIGNDDGNLKLYMCYMSWDMKESTKKTLSDNQLIFQFDYEDLVNGSTNKAEKIWKVDLGNIKYGIQTLEYDRDTGDIWCATRKMDDYYSLFLIDQNSQGNSLSLIKKNNQIGWDYESAGDGLCSLGNDIFYTLIPDYIGSTTTGTAKKVTSKDFHS